MEGENQVCAVRMVLPPKQQLQDQGKDESGGAEGDRIDRLHADVEAGVEKRHLETALGCTGGLASVRNVRGVLNRSWTVVISSASSIAASGPVCTQTSGLTKGRAH